ncbi:MAG: hypothetical protein MN733_40720 [Nitrososphaera sp.]|nr:hypothetical protein [Nitrososphaera sp.]
MAKWCFVTDYSSDADVIPPFVESFQLTDVPVESMKHTWSERSYTDTLRPWSASGD